MQRAVLFLSAPFFYVDKPFAKRITSLYGSWGILLAPLLGIILISIFFFGQSDDLISAGGDMFTIYCPTVGPGQGVTYSGNPLPYEPYCPQNLAPVYPLYITSVGVGKVNPMIIAFQLFVNLTSTIVMTLLFRAHKKANTLNINLSEMRAMCLGFQIKVAFNLASFLALIFVILMVGSPSPETSIFNKDFTDSEAAKIFFIFMPIAITPYILANFVEGVVFTYAIIQHEMMGINEKIRKTFTGTIFAGLSGFSFIAASELMESVIGTGWIGGVLIGIVFILMRQPLLLLISSVTSAMMPEKLSKEEEMYLNLYRIAMEDGIITKKERSMLQLHAQSNGISADRAATLEANASFDLSS